MWLRGLLVECVIYVCLGNEHVTCCHDMLLHAKPEVTAGITQTVADVISKIHDAPAVAKEVIALVAYVHDIFLRRKVVKQI